MAIGRGKQSFTEFVKEVTTYKKGLISDIRNGGLYTRGDIELVLDDIVQNYGYLLYDEDIPNPELWGIRAENHVQKIKEELFTKYYKSITVPEENITDEDGDDFIDDVEDNENPSGYLFGKPLLTPTLRRTLLALGTTPRKRIFPTFADLVEYVSDIPDYAIQAYEEITDRGRVIGYRVWIDN